MTIAGAKTSNTTPASGPVASSGQLRASRAESRVSQTTLTSTALVPGGAGRIHGAHSAGAPNKATREQPKKKVFMVGHVSEQPGLMAGSEFYIKTDQNKKRASKKPPKEGSYQQRHRLWLEELARQRTVLVEEHEKEAKNREGNAKRFKDKMDKHRQKIRSRTDDEPKQSSLDAARELRPSSSISMRHLDLATGANPPLELAKESQRPEVLPGEKDTVSPAFKEMVCDAYYVRPHSTEKPTKESVSRPQVGNPVMLDTASGTHTPLIRPYGAQEIVPYDMASALTGELKKHHGAGSPRAPTKPKNPLPHCNNPNPGELAKPLNNTDSKASEQSVPTISLSSDECRNKPAWARTAVQNEVAEEAEVDELLEFAENLDFDEYIDDLEVQENLAAVKKRVQQLEKERLQKQKEAEAIRAAEERERERMEREASRGPLNVQADSASIKSEDCFTERHPFSGSRNGEISPTNSKTTDDPNSNRTAQTTAQSRADLEGQTYWSSDTHSTTSSASAYRTASNLLKTSRTLRHVHSARSVNSLITDLSERSGFKRLECIGEDESTCPSHPAIQEPVKVCDPLASGTISLITRKKEMELVEPGTVPYLYRHPAI